MKVINELNIFDKKKNTLVIFPHAGSTSVQYINWSKPLLDFFNILILDNFRGLSVSELSYSLKNELENYRGTDLHYFGHSMGALLAYKLSQDSQLSPSGLILSGMNSPSKLQTSRFGDLAVMSLEHLSKYLEALGGIPSEVKNHPDLMLKFLQIAQSDFKLLSNLNIQENRPYNGSSNIILGKDDQICSLVEALNWKKYLNGSHKFKVFPGTHFYLFENSNLVHSYLIEEFTN